MSNASFYDAVAEPHLGEVIFIISTRRIL